MSVLCVHIPGFLLQLAYQAAPALQEQPLALLDAQERVCARNAPAAREGVMPPMRAQQALTCCPGLALRTADMEQALSTQGELLATLTTLGLPTEEHGWGRAYLDLQTAAHTREQAQETLAYVGKSLRASLGEPLAPALGWDSSKFTARAAAAYTVPGRMKLVSKTDERPFLAPLSTRLLPLPGSSLQELSWLGIDTLGQFAHLPVQSVVQRYGTAARTAHQWARGLDDRPVRPNAALPAEALVCSFDPPIAALEPVVAALQAKLAPQVEWLRQTLCGVRQLLLKLTFFGDETRMLSLLFVEPAGDLAHVMQHVRAQLEALNWPQALERLEVTRLESGELIVEQGNLFDQPGPAALTLAELAQRLLPRYGDVFRQARLTDPAHPLAERRFALEALA